MAFETADVDRFDFRSAERADDATEAAEWLPGPGDDPMAWATAAGAAIDF